MVAFAQTVLVCQNYIELWGDLLSFFIIIIMIILFLSLLPRWHFVVSINATGVTTF